MIVRNYYGNAGKKCAHSSDCSGRIGMCVNYVKLTVFKKFV